MNSRESDMTAIELQESAHIACGVPALLAFLADRRNDGRWWWGIFQAGSRRHRIALAGRTLEVQLRTELHDGPASPWGVTVRSETDPFRFSASFSFQTDGGGTLVQFHARVRPVDVSKVMPLLQAIPLMVQETRANLGRLKQLLERDTGEDLVGSFDRAA
jgi:hypothetical protein